MGLAIEPITVVIVDDDTELCNTLSRLFELDGRIKVLAINSSPFNAIGLLEKYRPKVLLLDINFNEKVSGIDILRMIRKREDIDIKILVYTIYARHETIFEALRAGANSYVWKDESTEHILKAIIDTAEGKAYISPSIAQMILDHFESYRRLLIEK